MKYFVITFLYCFGFNRKYVFGLECYATDFSKLNETSSQHLDNLRYQAQDCEVNIKEIAKLEESNILMTPNAPLRCYSLDLSTTGASKIIRVKGCLPQGSCDMMKVFFKTLLANTQVLQEGIPINCDECKTNLCNKNSAKSLSMTVYLSGLLIAAVFIVS